MVKTFIKIAVFLLANAYFVIQSSYVSEAALPPVCPYPVGYMEDPKNCSQYVICLDFQVAGVHACPSGLHFSESQQVCVTPDESDCSNRNRRKRDVSEVASTEATTDNNEFSCVNKKNGFYSDLSKCGSYYECKDGVASAGDCVGNYEWSTELNRCDKPANSDCTKRKQLLPNSTAGPSNLTDHSHEIPSTTELPPSTGANEPGSTTHADEFTDEPDVSTPAPIESTTTGQVDQTTPGDQAETTTKAQDDLEPSTDADELVPVTTDSPKEPVTTERPKEPSTTPKDEGDEIPTEAATVPTTTALPAQVPTTTQQPTTTQTPTTKAPPVTEAPTTKAPVTEAPTEPAPTQPATTPPPTTTAPPTSTQDPICKGDTDIQLPDTSDATCNSYYECDENGVSEKKHCEPKWLRFQPDWQACVPKFLVPCKKGKTGSGDRERAKRRQKEKEKQRKEREREKEEQEKEKRKQEEEEEEANKKERKRKSNGKDHDHDHDHDSGYNWEWDSGRRGNYREYYGGNRNGHRNGYRYRRYNR